MKESGISEGEWDMFKEDNNFNTINSMMDLMKSKGIVDDKGCLKTYELFPSEAVIEELNNRADMMRADPLMLRYARLALSCGDTGVIINEGWKALGEQRFNAGSIAMMGIPYKLYNTRPLNKKEELFDRLRISAMLMMAQTFVWKREVLDQLQDYPFPSCEISHEILPYPITYHTFETAIGMSIDGTLNVDWMLFGHKPGSGIELVHNVGTRGVDSESMTLTTSYINYGMKYPPSEGYTENEVKSLGFVLSFFAFLKSSYINVERQKLPRFIRRNDYKNGDKEGEREINIVQLRPEIRERLALYNSESKEWKHRWWVRGHYRKQWYPSTSTHEMIWIAPHIKGKEDLPMIDKIYTVGR